MLTILRRGLVAAWIALGLPAEAAAPAGYLFAHMTRQDYGRLYYSVSQDCLHWRPLHGGRRILGSEYWGHPDICRGHDGRFYLVGNITPNRDLSLWVSTNLAGWQPFRQVRLDLSRLPEFAVNAHDNGAPKIFFDTSSQTYFITWHNSVKPKSREDTELFWSGQRTLCITSTNLETFTSPQRLFTWELATIDTLLRREGDRWFALFKDERMPSFEWPTGKTIRIASASSPFGPWSEASAKISPNFHEAPMLIPRPDGAGWYLYYEQYPGLSYGLSTARTLAGPWFEPHRASYEVPKDARHGCMLALDPAAWKALLAAFPE